MSTHDQLPASEDALARGLALMPRTLHDDLTDTTLMRMRDPRQHLGEDLRMLAAGVLDGRSFRAGYQLVRDPVEVVFTRLARKGEDVDPALLVRNPKFFTEPLEIRSGVFVDAAFDRSQRVYTAIRRQHNLRTTLGRDMWQRQAMFSDIAASAYTFTGQATRAFTSDSATSGTDTGAVFPTKVTDAVTNGTTTVTSATAAFTSMDVGRIIPNGSSTNIPNNTYIVSVTNATTAVLSNAATGSGSGGTLIISRLQGKLLRTIAKYGVIMSNTDQIANIDQWYDPTSTSGASSATPGATSSYMVTPQAGTALWIALCATGGTGTPPAGGHAPAAGDILRVADGLFGDGSATGAATEQTGSGLARAYVVPTFPAAGQILLSQVFTYTGSTLVSLDVLCLCNSKAAQGSIAFLESQLNAAASLNSNGDTVTPSWTINL